MASPTFTQVTFRARNDNGSETTATWKFNQGINWTQVVDTNFRVRFLLDETASRAWNNYSWNLYYSTDGTNYSAVDTTTPVKYSLSANFTDGDDTTSQLTGGSGAFLANNNGMCESTSTTNTGLAGNYFEIECSLQLDSTQLTDASSIYLRIYNGTSPVASYTATPQITVSNPIKVLVVNDASCTSQTDALGKLVLNSNVVVQDSFVTSQVDTFAISKVINLDVKDSICISRCGDLRLIFLDDFSDTNLANRYTVNTPTNGVIEVLSGQLHSTVTGTGTQTSSVERSMSGDTFIVDFTAKTNVTNIGETFTWLKILNVSGQTIFKLSSIDTGSSGLQISYVRKDGSEVLLYTTPFDGKEVKYQVEFNSTTNRRIVHLDDYRALYSLDFTSGSFDVVPDKIIFGVTPSSTANNRGEIYVDNLQVSKEVPLVLEKNLVVDNCYSTSQADNVTLETQTGAINLSVNDSGCITTSDNITIALQRRVRVSWLEFQIPKVIIPALDIQNSSVTSQVDTVQLTQTYNLAVQDCYSTTQVDQPVLVVPSFNLVVGSCYSLSQVDNVSVIVTKYLELQNTYSTTQVDAVSTTKQSTLSIVDTFVTSQSDFVLITKESYLVTQDLFSTSQTDNIVLTKQSTLTVLDSSCVSTLDTFVLVQTHNLIVSDAFSSSQVDHVTGSGESNLVVDDTFVTTQSDKALITKQSTLVVQDSFSATQSDFVSITKRSDLVVQDSFSSSQLDLCTITQVHNLSINDSYVTSQADSVTISGAGYLGVTDSYSVSFAETVTLTQVHNLIVQDSFSTSQSDVVNLVQNITLTVLDTFCTDQTDSFVILQQHNIITSDTYVEDYLDTFALYQTHNITLTDIYCDTQLDEISLVGNKFLTINDTYSITFSDIPSITQTYWLRVDNNYVPTFSDSPSLTQVHYLVIRDAYSISFVDSPYFVLVDHIPNRIDKVLNEHRGSTAEQEGRIDKVSYSKRYEKVDPRHVTIISRGSRIDKVDKT